jgi:hypothetical protein
MINIIDDGIEYKIPSPKINKWERENIKNWVNYLDCLKPYYEKIK